MSFTLFSPSILRRLLRRNPALLIFSVGLICAPGLLQATTWIGGTSTDYNNPANWSGGVVPNDPAAAASIPGGTAFEPAVLSGSDTLNSLTLSSSAASLTVSNNSSLSITGSISNAGTVSLAGLGNFTQLILSGQNGTIALSGTGTMTLSDQSANRILGGDSGITLVNSSTIQGAGEFSPALNGYTLNNTGTITALATNNALILDPGAVTNTGTLQAGDGTNTGTLTLLNNTFTNTGGTVLANTGSTVNLQNATISGGTLSTAGTGVIQTSNGSGTLDGAVTLTAGSTLNVTNNTNLGITANSIITNNGTIALNSVGNYTQMILSGQNGTVTLDGSGTYTMSDQSANRILANNSGMTLVNNSTIQGAGEFSPALNGYTLNNAGTITALATNNALILDPGVVTNTGILQAGNGISTGTLTLQGDTFTNTGGHIVANNNSFVNLTNSEISGGILQSNGTGVIQTFNGSGTLDGAVTLTTGSTLNVTNNTSLGITAGSVITNNGTLALQGSGNYTQVNLEGTNGTVTLGGTGTYTMSDQSANRFLASNSGMTLVNNSAIQGAGEFSPALNAFTLTNNGTITALGTNNALVLDPGSVTNSATLQAGLDTAHTGTLTLATDTFTNTNGLIQANDGSIVNLQNSTISGGTLATAGSGVIQTVTGATLDGTVTLTTGSTLNVTNNTSLGITAGSVITNNGTIALNSVGNYTQVVLSGQGGTVTLDGSGTYTMSDQSANRILAGNSGMTLVNNSTIQGAGEFSPALNGYTLNNTSTGIITALGTHNALILDPGAVTNTGTLQAGDGTNTGTLTLLNNIFTNTSGTILANTGSTVNLQNATISGGTLSTTGTGVIQTSNGSGTLDGAVTLTAGSTLNVTNNTTLGITAGSIITNNGNIALNSVGNYTQMILSGQNGTVTLDGSGTYTMSDQSANRILATNSGMTLVNNSTIQGAGEFSPALNAYTIANNGRITANGTNQLLIDNGGNFTNNGILSVNAGSTLQIATNTNFTNFDSGSNTLTGGTYIVAGTLQFPNANIVNNAANITLTGATSKIVNQNGINGIDGILANNLAAGTFSIQNNRSFITGGAFSNAGSVNIGSTDEFTVPLAVYTQSGGTTQVDGNLVATALNINGGLVKGTGTIYAPVTNGGTVAPGDSPGTLTINGPYVQLASGTLNIAIAGSGAGQSSVLDVLQSATLDGTLDPILLGGFDPSIGDSFIFMDYLSHTGSFAGIANDIFNNGTEEWTVTYNATDAILTVAQGPNSGGGGPATPEPSTWALFSLGLLGLGYRGYRRSISRNPEVVR